jgi:hypothetical protein
MFKVVEEKVADGGELFRFLYVVDDGSQDPERR